jgi:hypothetical protein
LLILAFQPWDIFNIKKTLWKKNPRCNLLKPSWGLAPSNQ